MSIVGGTFTMGNHHGWGYPADGEIPRAQTVTSFLLAETAVTNAEFARFVADTGYQTDAERFGWSFVFGGLLPDDFEPTRGVASAPWWRQVFGASWDRPEGPHSNVVHRADHPVVHVSWNDANSYARWAGARLPTEAEWEYAALGGTTTVFPWGSELEPDGVHHMNVFQGTFPSQDTGDDGWVGTCPVQAYQPNVFGTWNQLGNVWEWCADWFVVTPDADPPDSRVMKGGSYLCHASYCRRYRPSARMGSAPDSTSGNVGFRLAR